MIDDCECPNWIKGMIRWYDPMPTTANMYHMGDTLLVDVLFNIIKVQRNTN
jgi:hypothetical protein